MFGYIQANVRELKVREYEEYRSYYCGLCHSLKKRYGLPAGLLLNYDMTFLALLLTALYEPSMTAGRERCLPHPVKRHPFLTGDTVDYAADMTILLSYMKAADDRKDEKTIRSGFAKGYLQKDYRRLRRRYPRQAKTLEDAVRTLWRCEKKKVTDIDLVAGLTGRFLGEMFAWKDDVWQDTLRQVGFFLGKFVYLMDAAEDLEEDLKKDRYNLLQDVPPGQVKDLLVDTMALSCRAFERLPIVERTGILRNILYAGVWMKYKEPAAKLSTEQENK